MKHFGPRRQPLTTNGEAAPERRNFAAVGSDYATWQALIGNELMSGKISRSQANSVPAVKRARDLVAGKIGTLPIHVRDASKKRVDSPLLNAPEATLGLVRVVTMTRTVEDLFYDGYCLWQVTERGARNFPTGVRRVPFGDWTRESDGSIKANGKTVPAGDAILFVSPNEPILTAGARAIRTLLLLDATAAMYAEHPEAIAWWRSTDGIDPKDEVIQDFLDSIQAARKARAEGYVPSGFTREQAERMTPEELQLATARDHAVLEIARLTGIDAEELSVSTTSRTYANTQDRREANVTDTLSAYLQAVEQRLSFNDVCPRGQEVRYALEGFLRGSTVDRYASYAVGLEKGFLTVDEVRALEDLPPLPGGTA